MYFTFSTKTQRLKAGRESKKEGTVCNLYEETLGFSSGLKKSCQSYLNQSVKYK